MANTRITQYIHRPNTTELGMGNTHETYMLVSSNMDISSIFPTTIEVNVEDTTNHKTYSLKSTSGSEFRVNQMGELYRDHNVLPGDEIIITKIEKNGVSKNYVTVKQYNRVVLLVGSKGCEIVNQDRLSPFSIGVNEYKLTTYDRGNSNTLSITFKNSQKKRVDSPNTTDYYNAQINNSVLPNGTYYLTLGDHSTITTLVKSDFNTIEFAETILKIVPESNTSMGDSSNNNIFLSALRTKPFLLLAGISGTGKSQKVQELAFISCPEDLREENSTTPGNYCLVEVKPNWHDSTELLGYYSALSGRYELTDFIRFTYKALTNSNTPFFLCLDEMNLAPVEQYFAEYLSVLETRKRMVDADGEIRIHTEPLLTKDKFSNCTLKERVPKQTKVYMLDGDEYDEKPLYSPDDAEIIAYLKNNGLHLPDNLFVIGTVNMDDTTHQFSRKVIDRAFTIEMNGGKMDEMFSTESRNNLEYRTEPLPLSAFKSEFVRAYEVLEDERFTKYGETITTRIPELLGNSDGTASEDSINGILNGTPFRVSYRVQNELVLYLSVLIENAGFPDDIEPLIGEATLAILMEKVLPRIQGEQKQLETKGKDGKASNVLKDMKSFVETHFKPSDETVPEIYDKVIKKLKEMDGKLSGYYTNFF
jgi:hypothetical protein